MIMLGTNSMKLSFLETFSPLVILQDLKSKRPSFGPNLDALDGIRGLAVLLVIAEHTNFLNLKGIGFVGVWLFFVLSGFLLTLPFVEHRLTIPSLVHYAKRRVLRIFPMYYFVLTLYWLFGTSQISQHYGEHLFLRRADRHLWTIPEELLFYCVLPAFVFCVQRFLKARPLWIIAFLTSAMIASNFWLDEKVFAISAMGRSIPFFLGIFLIGVLCAYAYHWTSTAQLIVSCKEKGFLGLLWFFSFSILFLSTNVLLGTPMPLSWEFPAPFGVACGLLILATLLSGPGLINRILTAWPTRFIGLLSFSLYLLHVPIIDLLHPHGWRSGTALFFLTLSITTLCSIVSYTLVERPFLITNKLRFANKIVPQRPGHEHKS
jgi:peptidoglycan/LPS O-acetylase OafA/YrhL